MGQIGKLSFKGKPVRFVPHKLVHRGVTVGVNAIVMRFDQITLNVIEGFHLDAAEILLGSAWSHGRIIGAIYELSDDKDRENGQVLGEHQRSEEDCKLAHGRPLVTVAE